jgi:hypothetical protein
LSSAPIRCSTSVNTTVPIRPESSPVTNQLVLSGVATEVPSAAASSALSPVPLLDP